ncbi:hypothetical protein [Microbacterium aurantiacum]|uniref:hypothetical protein n=1 Tax=Microbacterium aurantiacum TaxID=162393 RepID=UPI000C800815|nr:hypothetical protein [Microbacterium aurantiacum]
MSRVTTLVADEEAFLARNPEIGEIHADAVRAGRESVLALIDAHGALGASDERRFNREVEELQRRSLVDYARRVHGLLAETEVAPWRAEVDRLSSNPRNDLLRQVGVPGAVLLLDAMEPVPDPGPVTGSFDEALAAIADRCTCGYARERVVPRTLCIVCSMAISEAWQVEERRLLDRLPDMAAELDQIIDAVIDRHADLWNAPQEGFSDLAAGIRRKALRRVARVNKAHRDAKAHQDPARWDELAALAVRDARPVVQGEAKRWRRSGWGTARMSAIALRDNAEVKARMAQKARIR